METPAFIPAIASAPGLQKIATVSVPVLIRKPGNAVGHLLTFFEIHGNGSEYVAITICSEAHKTLTRLPNFIEFCIREDSVVENADYDYGSVVEGIVYELKKMGHL